MDHGLRSETVAVCTFKYQGWTYSIYIFTVVLVWEDEEQNPHPIEAGVTHASLTQGERHVPALVRFFSL